MLSFTQEQQDKIALLDDIVSLLSVEEIKEIFSKELVFDKLKGQPHKQSGIFKLLLDDNRHLENEVYALNAKIYALDTDVKDLIRILHRTIFNAQEYSAQSTFLNLKAKHNIY